MDSDLVTCRDVRGEEEEGCFPKIIIFVDIPRYTVKLLVTSARLKSCEGTRTRPGDGTEILGSCDNRGNVGQGI